MLLNTSGDSGLLRFALMKRLVILTLCVAFSACRAPSSKDSPTSDPSQILHGDAPIVALVGRSMTRAPEPYFVLYGNGRVIFGNPEPIPSYRTAMLSPEEVRDIYLRVLPAIFNAWNQQIFTPGNSASAGIYLCICREDGSFVSLATYSLPPTTDWPADKRPPEAVEAALAFLAEYKFEPSEVWTPAEIEVMFQNAVPQPEQSNWWPKTWPQPNPAQSRPTIRLDGSHAEELAGYLRAHPYLRMKKAMYDVTLRYPFPFEEAILPTIKALAIKQANYFELQD